MKAIWLSFNAWVVWSRHLKWTIAKPALSTTQSSPEAETPPIRTSPEQLRGAMKEESHDLCRVASGESAGKAEERFRLGRKATNSLARGSWARKWCVRCWSRQSASQMCLKKETLSLCALAANQTVFPRRCSLLRRSGRYVCHRS